MEKLNRSYIRYTKSILVGFISLLVLGACSSVPEEEVEETEVVDEATEVESEEEVEATEKEEAERKAEEERVAKEEAERKAKEEEKLALEAKEKEEEERKAKEEERKAEEERVAKEKEEEERKAEEERVAKEEADRKAKEEEELDVSLREDTYLAIIQENLSEFVDVEFNKDSKIFILTPNNEALNTEIAMLTQGIGHEDWEILVDGLASMSETGVELVGEGYSINLVNPHNEENILLWIMDGVVLYNVIDDL